MMDLAMMPAAQRDCELIADLATKGRRDNGELGIAKRLDELLNDPDKARCMRSRGKNFAKEHFSWARVTKDMVSLYDRPMSE